MAQFPALDIFTDAWLADTSHLGRIERDIYFHLLILMWRTPGCRVPHETSWIMRRLKCAPDEEQLLKNIVAEFCETNGNWITQKRLTKEFQYALKRSKRQSDIAKSKWIKEKTICHGNAKTMPENKTWHASGNAPTATATATDTDTERKNPPNPPEGGNRVAQKGSRNGRGRKQGYSIRESFQQAIEHIEARVEEGGNESGSNDIKLLP